MASILNEIKASIMGTSQNNDNATTNGSVISVDFGTQSFFGPIIVAAVSIAKKVTPTELKIINISNTSALTDKEVLNLFPRISHLMDVTYYQLKPVEWNNLADDAHVVDNIRTIGHNYVHMQNQGQARIHIAKGYVNNEEYNSLLSKVVLKAGSSFNHVQAQLNIFDKNYESHLAYIAARYQYIKFIEEQSIKLNARIPHDQSKERQEQFLFLLSQTSNGINKIKNILRGTPANLKLLKLSTEELRNGRRMEHG